MKEVWKRAQEVDQLKINIQKKLNLTVDDEQKADKVLSHAKKLIDTNEKKLQTITADTTSCYSTQNA